MDAIEAILSRRSIRKYRKKAIPKKLIDELLNAAMHAPSACNEQPWHFVIINNREVLDQVPKYHRHSYALREAPVAIVVCVDLNLAEEDRVWWVQDCSAAAENILIAAQAKGLGAVWLGVYPKDDRVKGIQGLLALPQNVIPLCIISIGYPAEKKPYESRYQSSRIHHNCW
jgi:nitroreductase